MSLTRRHDESQRLVRDSLDSRSSDVELNDILLQDYRDQTTRTTKRRISLSSILPWRRKGHSPTIGHGRSRWLRLLSRCYAACGILLLVLIILTPIFNPSYSGRPKHYTGTNLHREKVFIAANIVDEEMIRGSWGRAVVDLVELLGEENVFLSIYENDSGEGTVAALQELKMKLKCKTSIVSDHIDLDEFPSVQILPDERHVKRIKYLAKVRNMALEPLTASNTDMKFDKLLFINDVVFDARDAADLLFATNVGEDGKSRYHAACAMDFVNPFKFYDTFATRDAEGYGAGVPFYPFFTASGQGVSRNDVLAGTDAVRVKSCWGGMIAFEAKWFARTDSSTDHNSAGEKPIQFRATDELFWEASECCLVHADLAAMTSSHPDAWERNDDEFDHGIYMNPYIRVAYDAKSHSWLAFTRRFEKLYTVPQGIINWISGRPPYQPRRTLQAGKVSDLREWIYDGPTKTDGDGYRKLSKRYDLLTEIRYSGHWETNEHQALPGGFCGSRQLLVLKKHWEKGEKMWEKIPTPPGANDERFG